MIKRSSLLVVPILSVLGACVGGTDTLTGSDPLAAAAAASPPPGGSTLLATPPMGWSSGDALGCDVSDEAIREVADAIVSTGMKDAGYTYVIIDDCWQAANRVGTGKVLAADPVRFPGGIAAVAAYVHSLGLKLGLHTGAGWSTCAGGPGSVTYERQDMATFAADGVDYVQVDDCNSAGLDLRYQYRLFRDAIGKTSRPMALSIVGGVSTSPWVWAPGVAQLWRTTGETASSWTDVVAAVDANVNFAAAAGPGRWNDPSVLLAGTFGEVEEEPPPAEEGMGEPADVPLAPPILSPTEERAQLGLWAIMAAPLIAVADPRTISADTLATLTNEDVIAISQDAGGMQGVRVTRNEDFGFEVWAKPLSLPGTRAVALFNRTDEEQEITVTWPSVGLANTIASVRDVWAADELGNYIGSYTGLVPAHGVVVLHVTGQEPPAPRKRTYLSDMTAAYAAGGWGPIERDRANGGQDVGDGAPVRLNGVQYAKGVGTNSHSRVQYLLGARCTSFTTSIGIDDEVNPPWDPSSRRGSAIFEVWADGERIYQSVVMHSDSMTIPVSLNVAGVRELELVVDPAGDSTNNDHADWANAVVNCI